MRLVFMGTPQLAASILEKLADVHQVVGVFTRPDAVRGRGKKLVASPVKEAALAAGIPVHEARTLRDPETIKLLQDLAPDAICVAAYGAILPKEVLDIPPHGCLNVHTSLLPRWRGAAPIERAILACDQTTGVCIMRMEEGLDTGPYCVREEVSVDGRYVDELTEELSKRGAQALLRALEDVEAGTVRWIPQPDEGLTYASKIEKRELDLAPSDTVAQATAKVRASSASHPSRVVLAGRAVAVERASAFDEPQDASDAVKLKAGETTFAMKRLLIGVEDGVVELQQVKPDGKKSMEGRAFAAGVRDFKNNKLTWETR